ncbi:MAG: hypothetical protein EXS38_06410 [Opitutus sp.]|nr:hypothetical protein [Opitutus sp.]
MVINVLFLLLALLLLWFPRQWMRLGFSMSGRRKRNSSAEGRPNDSLLHRREQGDPAIGFLTEFGKLRNYVDLLRGAAGSLALMGGLAVEPCLQLASNANSEAGRWLVVGKLSILLVGLLIQTLRYDKQRINFFAPIFFLSGISVGLCGLAGFFFAFVMIWAINPLLRKPQRFLAIYSLLMAAFGWIFVGGLVLPVAALFFCYLPVLLSLLAQQPLVVYSRKAPRADATES